MSILIFSHFLMFCRLYEFMYIVGVQRVYFYISVLNIIYISLVSLPNYLNVNHFQYYCIVLNSVSNNFNPALFCLLENYVFCNYIAVVCVQLSLFICFCCFHSLYRLRAHIATDSNPYKSLLKYHRLQQGKWHNNPTDLLNSRTT